MTLQTNFKRYEIKYLVTQEQQKAILEACAEYIKPDEYGKSTICNLYYDTPDSLLIRRSLEKPIYKEKLRLRSYGVTKPGTPVFAEIKKKYDGVVYKRRIKTNEPSAMLLLAQKENLIQDSQIKREIEFFLKRYQTLAPAVFISYDREAFYSKEDDSFRITFDKNILWRDYDLHLSKGIYGTPVLDKNLVLMEIKCSGAIPLWFCEILRNNQLYKTSFSKYGRAYEALERKRNHLGGKVYA